MKKIILLGVFGFSFIFSLGYSLESLPQLLEEAPAQNYERLGNVSATKGKPEEARLELLRQAQKLSADAVILKDCKPASFQREGLTWYKTQASCEGIAIKVK